MKTMINIKTEVDVKKQAKKVADELGLPLGTLINAYLKEFIRTKEARFSILPQMTPRLEKILEGVERDLKTGRNLSPIFSSSEGMDKYLDN